MKKAVLFLLLVAALPANATNWITSYADAQKLALASNKFIMVDFWATWCGPCKKMDSDAWDDAKVNEVMENFIAVRIDIDQEKEFSQRYGIQSIPNMYILDGNGKEIYSFSGYHDAPHLLRELEKFALSTTFLAADQINVFKFPAYNSNLRLSQKYFDYAMMTDKDVTPYFIKAGLSYIDDAKAGLSKKDEGFAEKTQKLKLTSLLEYAYTFNFKKLKGKLDDLQEADVLPGNLQQYYFLKLVAARGLASQDQETIKQKLAGLENSAFYLDKADWLFSKKG